VGRSGRKRDVRIVREMRKGKIGGGERNKRGRRVDSQFVVRFVGFIRGRVGSEIDQTLSGVRWGDRRGRFDVQSRCGSLIRDRLMLLLLGLSGHLLLQLSDFLESRRESSVSRSCVGTRSSHPTIVLLDRNRPRKLGCCLVLYCSIGRVACSELVVDRWKAGVDASVIAKGDARVVGRAVTSLLLVIYPTVGDMLRVL
jgi:hypothetical protein